MYGITSFHLRTDDSERGTLYLDLYGGITGVERVETSTSATREGRSGTFVFREDYSTATGGGVKVGDVVYITARSVSDPWWLRNYGGSDQANGLEVEAHEQVPQAELSMAQFKIFSYNNVKSDGGALIEPNRTLTHMKTHMQTHMMHMQTYMMHMHMHRHAVHMPMCTWHFCAT